VELEAAAEPEVAPEPDVAPGSTTGVEPAPAVASGAEPERSPSSAETEQAPSSEESVPDEG